MCSQTGVSNKQNKMFKNLAGVDIKLIDLKQSLHSGFASELPVKIFKKPRCLQFSLGFHDSIGG